VKIAFFGPTEYIGTHKFLDQRLERLKEIFNPPKVTYAQVEFCESSLYQRCEGVLVTKEKVLDLIIEDIDALEKKILKETSENKRKFFERLKEELEKERFISEIDISKQEGELNFLISIRPVLKIDSTELKDLNSLLKKVFDFFGYIFFFTCNQKELKAWPIKKGTKAIEAAGKIHSDIAKGFIKAEVISFQDLISCKKIGEAKNRGLVRLESKDYVVQDADFITFKFSVSK